MTTSTTPVHTLVYSLLPGYEPGAINSAIWHSSSGRFAYEIRNGVAVIYEPHANSCFHRPIAEFLGAADADALAALLRRRIGANAAAALLDRMAEQCAETAVMEALRRLDAEAPAPDAGARITLPRSGRAPLRFAGEEIAVSDGERQAACNQNRWHELAVYRTDAGGYVVRVAYRTRWQGELDRDAAFVCAAAGDVVAALRAYDPTGPVRGFPPGSTYAERQERLLADLRARYEEQVSEVLASEEFTEVL